MALLDDCWAMVLLPARLRSPIVAFVNSSHAYRVHKNIIVGSQLASSRSESQRYSENEIESFLHQVVVCKIHCGYLVAWSTGARVRREKRVGASPI